MQKIKEEISWEIPFAMELNRRKRKLLEKLSRSSFAFAGTELIRELLRGETDKVGENFSTL